MFAGAEQEGDVGSAIEMLHGRASKNHHTVLDFLIDQSMACGRKREGLQP